MISSNTMNANALNDKEFQENKLELNSMPQRVFVELTRNCNSVCKMCLRRTEQPIYQKYNPEFNMDFKLFKSIADQVFPTANFIDLRGFGESTILPNFLDFVKYALKFKVQLGLITNCSIKNNLLWKTLAENNFVVGISLDGPNQETYSKIRPDLDFNQIIENIKILMENGCTKAYFLVTVQEDNIKSLPEFIGLAKKLGIKKIEFSPVMPEFMFDKIFNSVSKMEMQNLLLKTINLTEENNFQIHFIGKLNPSIEFEKKKFKVQQRCYRPWKYAYINYNGSISPCNHRLNLTSMGNLKEKTFKEAWNNEPYQNLRKIIHTEERPKDCEWCFKNRYL